MEVKKTIEGAKMTVEVSGRLNTGTAPQLEDALLTSLDGITELVLDFAGLEYISSAGLRIVMSAQKVMNRQGSMVVCNVRPEILEVFEMTGFVDFLTIQ